MSNDPDTSPTSSQGRARRVIDQGTRRVVETALNAATTAGRSVQRAGWKMEKNLDEGAKVVRRNPGKTLAVVAGLAAVASLVLMAKKRRR